MIVHLGVVLLAVGLAASESYRSDETVRLDVGESAFVKGHEFRYLGPGADVDERRLRVFAAIEIDGGPVYHPAATSFRRTGQTVPTPSVRSGPTEDLFLVLASMPNPDTDAIDLRIVVRPMVAWIWAGGLLMAVGTLLALIPGRRRRHAVRTTTASATATAASRTATAAPATATAGSETVTVKQPSTIEPSRRPTEDDHLLVEAARQRLLTRVAQSEEPHG